MPKLKFKLIGIFAYIPEFVPVGNGCLVDRWLRCDLADACRRYVSWPNVPIAKLGVEHKQTYHDATLWDICFAGGVAVFLFRERERQQEQVLRRPGCFYQGIEELTTVLTHNTLKRSPKLQLSAGFLPGTCSYVPAETCMARSLPVCVVRPSLAAFRGCEDA